MCEWCLCENLADGGVVVAVSGTAAVVVEVGGTAAVASGVGVFALA